jgi:hypothetical protein
VAVSGWDLLVETQTDRGYSTGFLPLWAWLAAVIATVLRAVAGATLATPRAAGTRLTWALTLSAVPVAATVWFHAIGSQAA